MKSKIKIGYLLLIGFVITALITVSFSLQTDLLIFGTTTILFTIAGILLKHFKSSIIKKCSLLLSIVFLDGILLFYMNPLLFPEFTPTIFIVSCLSVIIGNNLSIKWKQRTTILNYSILSGWFFLIGISLFYIMPNYEYNNKLKYKNESFASFEFQKKDGSILKSSELMGSVVILDFWNSRCGICRKLYPKLKELSEAYKNQNDIKFFTVNDGRVDSFQKSIESLIIQKYDFNLLYDSASKVSNKFNITGVPVLMIIDKKGTIRYSHAGYNPDEDFVFIGNMESIINKLL